MDIVGNVPMGAGWLGSMLMLLVALFIIGAITLVAVWIVKRSTDVEQASGGRPRKKKARGR